MSRIRINACLLCLGCMLLGAVVGCSDGKIATETVEGIVTLDGAPLADAKVRFSPETPGEGEPSYGVTDESGHYKLQTLLGAADAGTTPGVYIVTISKSKTVETGVMLTEDGETFPEIETEETLPSKYAVQEQSKLRATVVAGENTFDFPLESK